MPDLLSTGFAIAVDARGIVCYGVFPERENEEERNANMFNQLIVGCAERVLSQGRGALSYEEACRLARLPGEETLDLLACAHKITRASASRELILCSIVNAKSGFCTEDCGFCAQSSHHQTDIPRYDLEPEEVMVEAARERRKAGANHYSMVTSGLKLTETELATVCRAARRIVEETDLHVCSSVGTLTAERARQLRENGVTEYHHNLETARSYFDRVCTTHAYDDDVETVKNAKAAGLRVCSGGILGLGESWEQRVELACTLRDLDVDCIPLNFLNPIPGTRMESRPLLPPMEALKCIALFRFINPEKNILICGGREVTLKDFQSWIFYAGANGLLVGNYLTTQGRDIEADREMIRDFGLEAAI